MTEFIAIICILSAVSSVKAGTSLLNFYASQNRYTTEMFQAPLSLENVMAKSSELALQSCQASFKWQRWNCPSNDFFQRRTSKPTLLDAEDAYVTAIATAATLYTITKDCSSGIVSNCGCNDNTAPCSDDPQRSEELLHKQLPIEYPSGFHGIARKHNHKAVTTLLRNSLVKECKCSNMGPAGCTAEVCLNVLKPFHEIAADVRRLYDEGLQLNDARTNSQIVWQNVPLDALVYMKDSPNYCEPDAVLQWKGMRGRQCSNAGGDQVAGEESTSCQNLCLACGYRVHVQNVMTERRCNCKFTWGFQVHCDVCLGIEQQHYCY